MHPPNPCRTPSRLRRAAVAPLLSTLLSLASTGAAAPAHQEPLVRLEPGASVVLLGNTFAERMSLFGWFETYLHCRLPEHELRVRNLGWSADEVGLRPRPVGFPDLHEDLGRHGADVILLCFGMNEAFPPAANRGRGDLGRFAADLGALVGDLRGREYNGRSAPQVVLVSPIAHERLGGTYPDPVAHRARLAEVTAAMATLAEERGLAFVDLHTPTAALMAAGTAARAEGESAEPLTINGIHLTSAGYQQVGQLLAEGLGLGPSSADDGDQEQAVAALRRAVLDKNSAFFLHWHGPNMEYVHGRRRDLAGGLGLPAERERLELVIAELEQRIWAMEKPAPGAVWRAPIPGTPPWITPPDYLGLEAETGAAPDHAFPEHGSEAAPRPPQKALASFDLPEGYAINLYASECDFPIANPVAMDFDAQGRLWIANSPTWPHPEPGTSPSDSIVVLEDTDGDGDADEHTVFLDGLHMIHGFALGEGGAYVSQTPLVVHALDGDGDGRADRFEARLHGFGGEDVEHSINNYRWGPDGGLYFMEGIFFHTQVETPRGPRRVVDGGVFRWEPRTGRFDVQLSYAFWNPWGIVFDEWGEGIVLDASSHDYFPVSVLSASYVYPKEKYHLHGELSFAPEGLGPAAGIELLRSRHFPDEVQGRLLANQLSHGFRGTRWHTLTREGTSYSVESAPPLLQSADPSFRPLALTIGPDGALYVLDFYSYLIENTSEHKREPGRDHTHGRVWRITYPARPLVEAPTIAGAPTADLLELLGSYEERTRRLARQELQARDAAVVLAEARRWGDGLTAETLGRAEHERRLLEVLWLHQGLGVPAPDLLDRLLGAGDPRARAAATRTLRWWMGDLDDPLARLAHLVDDEDPRVRLEAVLACGVEGSARARAVALEVLRKPMDRGLQLALDETMNTFDRLLPEDR